MPRVINCIIPRRIILWSVFGISLIVTLCLVAAELKRMNSTSHQRIEDVSNRSTYRHLSSKTGTKITHLDLLDINGPFFDYPICNTRPFLLILVTSAPQNFHRRSAIRQTWGRTSLQRMQGNLSSRTVFLIGRTANSQFLNILVENEQLAAGDIVIGNYYDTYRNLTLKVLHGITWSRHYCEPSYLLKTDDDCFVNVAQLLSFLSRFNVIHRGLYVGYVQRESKVIRDPSSRWYVSMDSYPHDYYEPYVCGIGYVLSRDVIELLSTSASNFKPFPNEDAYIGYVLNLLGVSPIHSSRFTINNGPWQLCNFLYLFVVHRVSADEQRQLQAQTDTALVECAASKVVMKWN